MLAPWLNGCALVVWAGAATVNRALAISRCQMPHRAGKEYNVARPWFSVSQFAWNQLDKSFKRGYCQGDSRENDGCGLREGVSSRPVEIVSLQEMSQPLPNQSPRSGAKS
jgi:hypothetical protein